jgi:uncharacterized protein YggE
MSTPRLAALLAAAALLAVVADHSFGPQASPARAATTAHGMSSFLRFTGTGTATVRPDQATIYLSTSGRGTSLGAATDAASSAMQQVIAAMRRDGVQAADMQTGDTGGGRQGHGSEPWVSHQSLTVIVRQVARTGRIEADAIAAGATANSGPDFSQSDQAAGRSQAIAKAVADARTQANAAAAAAGLRVTGVVSITANGGGYPIYGLAEGVKAAGAVSSVPVQRGSQQVNATVTVTFSIAPA